MIKTVAALICFAISGLLSSLSASAFEVQPMRHSLFPSSGQNTSIFTVRNTRSQPLPVEIIVEKRVYGENGVQTQVAADDDFVIFPFQALIDPGASQAFRFQYLGDPVVAEESAYTIHVREVPVDLQEGFTGLRYVYDLGIAVYIENADLESELTVTSVTREDATLNLILENRSSSFARLTNDQMTLSQDDTRLVLEGQTLMGVIDGVVVPPNNSLSLKLNLADLELAAGDISVSLGETPD